MSLTPRVLLCNLWDSTHWCRCENPVVQTTNTVQIKKNSHVNEICSNNFMCLKTLQTFSNSGWLSFSLQTRVFRGFEQLSSAIS